MGSPQAGFCLVVVSVRDSVANGRKNSKNWPNGANCSFSNDTFIVLESAVGSIRLPFTLVWWLCIEIRPEDLARSPGRLELVRNWLLRR